MKFILENISTTIILNRSCIMLMMCQNDVDLGGGVDFLLLDWLDTAATSEWFNQYCNPIEKTFLIFL